MRCAAPLSVQKGLQGAGIRILTPTISSPTLADQLRSLLKVYPQAKWHVYEPVNRDNVLEGAKLAFGQPVETQYDFENADVILSLDADFLYAGFPGFARYARDFAKRRNPDAGEHEPAVCGREHAEFDRGEGGSPLAGAGVGHGVVRQNSGIWLGDDIERGMRCNGVSDKFLEALVRICRAIVAPAWSMAGRSSAASRARFRSRHQPGAGQCRQDGLLHRSGRREPGESDRVAERSGRRHARRQSGCASYPGRKSRL